MEAEDDVIRVGSNVVIDLNGTKYSFIRIRRNGTVKVAGKACSTEPLIGVRFGSAFLLNEDRELTPADTNPHETIANATETDKNNSDLVGKNMNQKLTQDEVMELKHQNKGSEILKALQDGSTTFAGKTEFSQEKWLKKKAKKYLQYIVARRPTSDLICQVYYSTTPAKVFNMRADTLSIMMHAANVGPHSKVLCLDASGGVAAAACVERMGGSGTLCCAHAEAQQYHLDAVRLLNCHKWLAQSSRHCALTALLAARTGPEFLDSEGQNTGKKQKTAPEDSECKQEPSEPSDKAPNGSNLKPNEEHKVQEGNEAKPSAPGDCDVEMSTGEGAAATTVAASETAAASMASEPTGSAAKADAVESAEGGLEKDGNGLSAKPGDAPEADAPATTAEGTAVKTANADGGAAEKPARPVRAASALLRLGKPIPEGFKVPEMLIPAGEEDLSTMAQAGFTSLVVVAPRLEPSALLSALLPLLKPSASVAVFASSLPPLAECFQKLQAMHQFAALQIKESWWREIQVLPMRTHPKMTTSGTGGYLLTCTRVNPVKKPAGVEGDGARDGKGPKRKKFRV